MTAAEANPIRWFKLHRGEVMAFCPDHVKPARRKMVELTQEEISELGMSRLGPSACVLCVFPGRLNAQAERRRKRPGLNTRRDWRCFSA